MVRSDRCHRFREPGGVSTYGNRTVPMGIPFFPGNLLVATEERDPSLIMQGRRQARPGTPIPPFSGILQAAVVAATAMTDAAAMTATTTATVT